MEVILKKLQGNDLWSIGKADEVVKEIVADPTLFEAVFQGMFMDDPVLRMRSSDAIEKVSRAYPEYLEPYKEQLLDKFPEMKQKEVRWHVAQMVSYLKLTNKEMERIAKSLFSWVETEKSKIVIVNSLQTLTEFAEQNKTIKIKRSK